MDKIRVFFGKQYYITILAKTEILERPPSKFISVARATVEEGKGKLFINTEKIIYFYLVEEEDEPKVSVTL